MFWKRIFQGRFNDHPTNYYPLLALFAASAYEDANWIEQYIDLQNAQKIHFSSLSDLHAAGNIYEWPDGIIAAFKGTDSISQALDYLTGSNSHNLGWSPGAVSAVAYDYFDGIREQAQTFMTSRRDKPLIIVGHSLGGSLAKLGGSLAVSLGCKLQGVFTFGAPRFESKSFNDAHRFPCFCLQSAGDPVPLMPLKTMIQSTLNLIVKMKWLWFPKRYGNIMQVNLINYLPRGNTLQDPGYWKNFYQQWEAGVSPSWFAGDEPEVLLGIPNLIDTVLGVAFTDSATPDAFDVSKTTAFPHSIDYYIWVSSFFAQRAFGQSCEGMHRGSEVFKSYYPYFYFPRVVQISACTPMHPDLPGTGDKRELLKQWVFQNYGRFAYDDFMRQDLSKRQQ